ncbi:ABC transporter substrate-binding protein [Neobacillus vireti]|uniref:Probable sugar-binding periplasmic protein n=1 Tax=Neobacillus vireti LMG 21834 TaxID=1131730 RepID=A0AB94ITA9_9BACI|nr:ABC transporter substrate-binding protein [Neobacillus vireti]ETI70218.1 family 1 extracellular solute-binding protein [Neobacillus vireti LMG 21834]KLT16419.1 ABC transporter substrate-binding protein [Neobacillus vireti]
MKKRWLSLVSLLLVFSFIISGCSSSTSTKDKDDKKAAKLEIFSWWTGAGEEDGLKALIKLFKEKYPNVPVENAAVAGGAGTNAKAVLASRMQGNDPPATFQVHGGAELNAGWVAAGKMEPLNDLYEKEGWKDKFPQSLIDMVSKDGNIYSVPVNIHRGNVIWYNKKIFADNGLTPPKTFDEFFAVADKLKTKGITPLSLGDKEPWTATMLFEDILVGTIGTEKYIKLWSGDLPLNDPGVVEATKTFKKMLDYVNADHSSRNWQDASQMVGKGEAAMNVMGDWAKGYFVNDLKLKTNEDFGFITTPGTEGDFLVITDTFGLPKGVKNPDDVKKFLSVLGSVEGQDAFNPLKGSIPARIDADPAKYDEYGKQTIADFKDAKLAPSLAHGSAAPEGFLTKVNQAINIFVTQKDVDQFIDSLVAASSDLKK